MPDYKLVIRIRTKDGFAEVARGKVDPLPPIGSIMSPLSNLEVKVVDHEKHGQRDVVICETIKEYTVDESEGLASQMMYAGYNEIKPSVMILGIDTVSKYLTYRKLYFFARVPKQGEEQYITDELKLPINLVLALTENDQSKEFIYHVNFKMEVFDKKKLDDLVRSLANSAWTLDDPTKR